jgi:ABC-2 type transport system permease protein
MNNNILMLIRRETWEHRSLWIAPLVVAGVLLVISAFGGVHFNERGDGDFWMGYNSEAMADLPPAERERMIAQMNPKPAVKTMIVASVFATLTVVQMVVLGIVVFFYLLDTLLAERRDRSILFWKSHPISDGEVVASKALTALVVAPLFVLVVSAVSLLLFSAIIALRLHDAPFTPWDTQAWLSVQAVMLGFVPMVVLWYLPLAGYLLVVSVWVRKNAFLWAVLPPVGLLLIEKMITHTNYVGDFLGHRFAGYVLAMNPGDLRSIEHVGTEHLVLDAYRLLGQVFADYEIWAGVAAGLALVYLAVRIRRLRDDS